MAGDVVGEVRVKVRPDATGFRRDTDHEVDDALRGVRAEVPIDGKLRVDHNRVQRQLDQARSKLRGGDVKITAKIEAPVNDAYKEWAAAADKVKKTYDELQAQQKKWRGANDKRNDPLRMQLNEATKNAGELRQVYEDLSKDTRRIQLRDNKRLLDQEEQRTAALEAEKGRLAELTASQLFAERDRQRNLGNSVLAEQELERRRTANRYKSSFDYQRQQAKDNKAIELENRRHVLAMMDHTGGMAQAAAAGNLQDYLMKTPSDKFLQMNAKAVNDSFAAIRHEADKTADHIDKLDPQLKVEPVGLMAMAAQMQWASRPRTVPFYVAIDQKSYAIAMGMLKSLSGLGVLGKLGEISEDVLVNFDKFALKAGTVAVAAAGLVSSLGWLGSSSVAVANDLLALSGGLLFVPAALAGLAANMVIHTAAFKDFGDAVDGDNEALAKLPENAQKAAKSLRGLWDEMAKPIRENFWEGMGDEFAKTVDQLAPKFTEGLADSATHIGAAWGEVGRAMRELDDRGELKTMLDNMTTGFENAAGAAHPLAEAINIIGLRGSEQLPRLGGWVAKIGTGFRDWVKEADEAGKLTEWLLEAEEAAGHVGTVVWDTGRAFKALADVSLSAGSDGLRGMAESMGNIADIMSGEPWQSDMTVLLMGARRGAAELNDGFLDLSGSVADASVHFGRMLDLLGQLGGEVLTSVSIVVDNEGFQDGSTVAVEGMLKMVRDLAPAFDDAGTILGVFSRVAGSVFGNVGGLIGDVVGLVKDLSLTLEDNLVGLVPILGDNLRLLVDILDGPLEAVFGVLNNMLGVFNDMPGPLQTVILTLGALVAMRGSIGSLLGMFGTKTKNALSGLTSEIEKQPGLLAPLRAAWRDQLAIVDRLNPATMRYATSVSLLGQGRATIGHLATAYQHLAQVGRDWQKVSDPIAGTGKAIGDGFKQAGTGLREAAHHAFLTGEALREAGGRAAADAQPFTTASRTIGRGFQEAGGIVGASVRTMGANLGSLATNVGRAAMSVGGAAAGSLKSAAAGLSGALGGGWGLAIGGAIALIGAFAAKNASAKAKVDSLTASLDDQTGKLNAGGIKEIAESWTDLDEAGDGWANFTRGAKAANETMGDLGINLGDVTSLIVQGGKDFGTFTGHLDNIAAFKATEAFGFDKTAVDIASMEKAARGSAAALGINWDALKDISGADLSHAISNIKEEEAALRLSEEAWKGVAEAQGQTSGEAKLLAASMKSIGDESVAAADKIGAIRTSLDILQGGAASARDAEMAAAGMHAAALEQATALGERIAVGGEALFDATGMLNNQSAIGRDMHQMLRDSADGLLIEAQAAADAAKLRGETVAQQGEAAMKVMDGGQQRLEALAAAAGVSVEQLQADWDLFFGQDWMLEATFTATADKFLAAQELANSMGIQWSQSEFEAFLSADPDPASITAAELAAFIEGQMAQQFQAALTAISPQAMSELQKVMEGAANYTNADWVAALQAMNKTHPGIYDSVTAIANMTGGDYRAAINAINATAGGIGSAKWDLNNIPPALVAIISQWAGVPSPPYIAPITVPLLPAMGAVESALAQLRGGFGADGAIWDGKGSPFAGPFGLAPMVNAYANGGIENHVAQIARPSQNTPIRIWAEPETHGESYIPHSVYKRKRSLEIWKETGKILGVDMTAYENGGVVGGRASASAGRSTSDGVTVNIDQMVNHSDASPDDFARSLFRKVRAAGVYTPMEVF